MKAKTKKTVIAEATAQQGGEEFQQPVHANIDALYAAFGMKAPTWKRTLAACVAAFAIGFFGTLIASPIISVLASGMLAMTGSTFIALCVTVLGWLVAIYGMVKASQTVGLYIISGDIDADLAKLKNKFTGLFKRTELVAA